MTLVSIVIPCWNAERSIAASIESALGQTYPNVEVIVVDDGSTDGSLDIIKSFRDRVQWETGPNRGASAARNRGLEMARGELVQFLDADDLLYAEKLSIMVPTVVAGGGGVIPICDGDVVTEASADPPRPYRLGFDGGDSFEFCLRRPVPTPSPVHRRSSLLKARGFSVGLPCSQERDLHLRLTALGLRLLYVPKILYRVIDRPNSVSADYVRVLDQHAEIFLRARDMLAKRGALTASRRRAIAEALAKDARHYIRRGHDEPARRYFKLAAEVDVDGGLGAFGHWSSRSLARLIGPLAAEIIIRRANLAVGIN